MTITLQDHEIFLIVVDNGRAGTTIETYGNAFILDALSKKRGITSKIKNIYVAREVKMVETTIDLVEL